MFLVVFDEFFFIIFVNFLKVQNPRKKRGSRQSKNGNPFRIDDAQSGRDDNSDGFQYPDDFRFGE